MQRFGGEAPEHIRDRISAALAEMRAVRPGLDFSFSAPRLDPGFDTPLASELVAAAAALTGGEPATVSFGTEAPQMAALGAEVVVCGPGDMLRAHRRHEYVTREELAGRLYAGGEEVHSNAIEVHVHALRRKLNPQLIQSARGVGYMVRGEA